MTLDTRALRDAHAKTTPGRWESGRTPFLGVVIARNTAVAQECTEHDLAFIVLAHEQMPALLDEVESLRAEVARLKAKAGET